MGRARGHRASGNLSFSVIHGRPSCSLCRRQNRGAYPLEPTSRGEFRSFGARELDARKGAVKATTDRLALPRLDGPPRRSVSLVALEKAEQASPPRNVGIIRVIAVIAYFVVVLMGWRDE